MAAQRIALLILDGVTLAEVLPIRDRLASLGHAVTLLVPECGSVLPICGRYFAGAGGVGVRRALGQVAPVDFDLLVLPDSVTAADLMHYPSVLDFIQRDSTLIIATIRYLTGLLDRGCSLSPLACPRETALSGATRDQ